MAKRTELVITHPGSAHFDEVVAIAILMAVHGDTTFRIERREPTTFELDDPNVWVIDIGNRHQPAKRNFDHHQDHNCPASFVLVAEHLGLLQILSITPWWQFKDSVDRIGPVESSLKYNAGDDLVNRNPVESWLVASFAADPVASAPILKSLGLYLIREAKLLQRQLEFWKTCRRLTIAGLPAIIGETRDSAGLEEFRRTDKNPPDIVISLDRRDDGWRLFRFDGVPVNFSLIAGRPEILFAHKNGFMAKTKERLPLDKLIPLISQAVINSPRGQNS